MPVQQQPNADQRTFCHPDVHQPDETLPAMPTYVYRRKDGTTFEVQQRITEPALEVCPTTGQEVKRVISGAGLIFKGSGFYLTDYARNGGEKTNGSSTESKSETKPEAKSGDKPAEKSTPAKSDS